MSTVTKWGDYVRVGAVNIRAGWVLSFSPATVTASTTSVVASGTLRLQQSGTGHASGSDSWTITGGADASGTKTWSTNSSGQIVTIGSFTRTINLAYGTPQTLGVTGRVFDVGPTGSTAQVSGYLPIPARPVLAPNPPSALDVDWVSDSRVDLSWSAAPTAARPIDKFRVTRSVNNATWTTVVNGLPGSARAWSDTRTSKGNVYRYNIVAQNAAGETVGTPEAVTVSTTPATMAAPVASKNDTDDVVVARGPLSPSATSWSVKESGGATLATGIPASQETWTHPDPDPAKTWAYVTSATSSNPALTSDWSAASNTIRLAAPPLAPTPLGPSVADPAESFPLEWRHNSADGTPQRAYQIESRATAGDAWVPFTGKIESTSQQHHVPVGTWLGTARQWRVRTWGQHATPSPYSATALLALSARPVVGITYPVASHDSQRLVVTWSFYDPDGSVQTSWRVTLLQDGRQLEVMTGGLWSTQASLRSTLLNGATYTVRVEARDGAGLWSVPDERTFTVSYAPPPTPVLEASWRPDDGYVVLSGSVPAPVGSERPLDHVRLERASASGWVLVADDMPEQGAVTDMIPPAGTVVTYRAVAVSDIGSEAYTETVVETLTRWVFINHGPGFGQVVRVWAGIQATRSFARDKKLKQYAGRPLPLEVAGTARTRTYSLTGTLFAPWEPDLTSTYDEFEAAADAAAPVCVRDPEGVRMFVSTGAADLSGYPDVTRQVSMTLTQVDYPEQAT